MPKLPRGRGLKLSKPDLIRIAFLVIALIGVIMLTGPCARSVSNFVTGFDNKNKAARKPGTVDVPKQQHYEQLKPGMSEEEIKAAIERSKAQSAGSGSAAH